MIFVLLGIMLGLLVSLGPLSFLSAPFDALINFLVGVTGDFIKGSLEQLSSLGFLQNFDGTNDAVLAVSAVLGAITPGAVAFALVYVSRASKEVRQKVAVLALLVSLLSFFVVPVKSALLLLVLAALFGVIAGVVQGSLVTMPLIAVATIMGVRYGVLLWGADGKEVLEGALTLSTLVGGASSLFVWKLALSIAGLTPFFFALRAAFFKR